MDYHGNICMWIILLLIALNKSKLKETEEVES